MEFQNVYVDNVVKSFTIYYIKCVCPRICVNGIYIQEFSWKSTKKVSTKNLNNKKFLATHVMKKNVVWVKTAKPKIGLF